VVYNTYIPKRKIKPKIICEFYSDRTVAETVMCLGSVQKTRCEIVVEATVADCSTQPVQHVKTLVSEY